MITLRKQLSQQQLSQQQLAQQQLARQQQNGVHGIEDSKLLERANSLATRNVSLQVKVHKSAWSLSDMCVEWFLCFSVLNLVDLLLLLIK